MKKKNLLKKLGALVMAAALTMGMATTTLAYNEGTTESAKKGSITVHKFTSMATTDTPGTGNEIGDTSSFGTPAAGVAFELYKLDVPDLAEGEGTYTGKYTVSDDTVNFEVTGGTAATSGKDVTIGDKVTEFSNSGVTDENGELIFGKGTNGEGASNLEQGHYLLRETGSVDGYTAASPDIVISIPMTAADGTENLYDIHVYPKNISDELITKTLDDGDALVSPDTAFTWTIHAAFQSPTDETKGLADLKSGDSEPYTYGTFSVTDTHSPALTVDSAVLTVGDTTLTAGDDYTTSNTVANTTTWALTSSGIDKAIEAGATELKIVVTTSLKTFGTSAGTEAGIYNKASSHYVEAGGSDPGPGTDPTTPEVNAPKVNIQVEKALSQAAQDQGDISLDGIKFVLATTKDVDLSQAETENPTGFVLGADNKPVIATTDATGSAFFEGVPYDKTNGNTYYLIEYQTKEGLQLKDKAIEIKIEAGKTSTDAVDYEYTVKSGTITNYLQTETDPDNPTFQLPLTGGIGSVIFIAVGALIVLGGVAIVLRSRKRQ